MINTIIFDMGMVLIDFRWRQFYHDMGLTGERFERMADATVRHPIWNEFDRGEYTDEMMLEGFIKNDPEMEPEIRIMMGERFPEFLKKYDYTDEWMDYYKSRGYKIYILSNFSGKAFRDCADELDYVKKADGAVISYQVGLIKPDPAIYRLLLDKYDIDPKEAVFIDDNKDNIEAAKQFGLSTILFTSREDADKKLYELGVR